MSTESHVTYDQLQDLEDDFEEVELELIRQQAKLSQPLYAKRAKLVADIPNFWPLVFEQSPSDIDEYIQPSDAALLLGSLRSLSVDRFELPGGDPRNIAIRFDFAENDHFYDQTIEKKFWWRRAKDGWTGLVSEPVDIDWKSPDKDLTGGMLALARKIWEEDGKAKNKTESDAKKQLKEQMNKTGLGGVSFFAWFGFRGRDISADESREATEAERQKRQARDAGKQVDDDDDDDKDDDVEDEYEYEVFPTADDLALAIAEDLWPGATKYFIQAQEQDAMSDAGFESGGGEMSDDDDDDDRQKKRRRNGD
ncbi:hypothetical protein L249_4570 [Ophiocordyceps polyrhachis-furcata BCC 54312]|uniref:Nucleosome assembly protein n=1 Tax=Ophiocordyceps polyrhachis-furcata BCC 54312 TaxID=1330021 RepID=A0A367KZ65_9HYPO|nr:hypothetical protein L249_4570 [Ophiocordyceps polyrhachis-furcata BCC 54312]